MLSMVTAVMVCAVLGTMTVAPMSRPNDCATSCVSITHAQLAKKAPAVRLQPTRCGLRCHLDNFSFVTFQM